MEVKTFPLAFFLFLEEMQQNSACEAVRQLLSSAFPQSKNPKYQKLVLSHRKQVAPYVNTSQTVWFKFLILASVYLGLKVLMWFNLIYAI